MDNSIENWITPNPAVVETGETLVNAVQEMAGKGIGAILVTDGGTLAGIFTERDLLRLFSGDNEEAFKKHLLRPIGEFMTRKPICADISDDYNTVYMKMKTHEVRHIPILEGGRLVGIVSMRDLIHFYQNKLETAFNEARREIEDLKKLVSTADSEKIVTLIREVQKYKELSLTDHLTGLFNKRYFQTRLEEEVARARRSGDPLSLIFCDIDYFKRINDRFGHDAGDRILQEMGRILSGAMDELNVVSRLRKSDIVARYGGEEFVVILPETGKHGAVIAAERLRNVVGEYPFQLDGEEVHITMSFGVAELTSEDTDHGEIIRKADRAMYAAKSGGRNRVAAYPPEAPEGEAG